MKVALPVWEDRISPVFDVARHLMVVEVDGKTEVDRRLVSMEPGSQHRRVQQLVELGVDILICGGVSRTLEEVLGYHRIAAVPWVSGEVDEVMASYLAGALLQTQFAMPGCRGRQRAGRGRGGRGGRHRGIEIIGDAQQEGQVRTPREPR